MRDGEKGPVEIELVTRRVQTRLERKRTGPDEWLVVTRRPLADTRTLEPQGSPDATDQDARYRYRYSFSPTGGPQGSWRRPRSQNWRASSQRAPVLKRVSNEARVKRGWTSTRCAPGKAGIIIWPYP